MKNTMLTLPAHIANIFTAGIAFAAFAMLAPACQSEVKVAVEHSADTADFGFQNIPAPAINDSGATARWSIVRGDRSANGGNVETLTDGKIPSSDDSPSENFFFDNATNHGSLLVDLGNEQMIREIAAYSWHPAERAAQAYTVFGSNSLSKTFEEDIKKTEPGAAPALSGWTKIASVNTALSTDKNASRTSSDPREGGQHASRIYGNATDLGSFRYLLFDIAPSDPNHPFGRTFFSEIDIITEADVARTIRRIEALERKSFSFATDDNKYQFTIDTTAAPNLEDWCKNELQPVIKTWYPKIVELLPSENFEAPQEVRLRFLPDAKMNGTPAYAQNNRVTMNAEWYARELKREALGATVHELVHVVQQYNGRRTRGQSRPRPTPGWITEGIPDYIRWFLYEPESRGAILNEARLARAKHDDSYRTSANFIDYVCREHSHGKDIVQVINAAAREGRYSANLWKELTGLDLPQLEEQWKKQAAAK